METTYKKTKQLQDTKRSRGHTNLNFTKWPGRMLFAPEKVSQATLLPLDLSSDEGNSLPAKHKKSLLDALTGSSAMVMNALEA